MPLQGDQRLQEVANDIMVPPVFSVQSGWTLDDMSQVTVTRGPTTFVISVRFSDVERTAWGRNYLQRIGRLPSDDIDNTDNATSEPSQGGSELLLSRCSPLMLKLAPTVSIQGLPVEVLCSSPTYRLELLSTGAVEDDGVQIVGAENLTYEPSHDLSPLPILELPAPCAGILRVPASTLTLATADGQADPRAAGSSQGKVQAADGLAMYFKPRFAGRETQFEREAHVLGRIAELGLHSNQTNRLSRLVGIVTTGKFGEQVAGILLAFIVTGPGGGDCLRRAVQARTEMHEEWKAQVGETVKKLHAHQLVWGDVNAGNVVIDESSNAWVIDFGGLNNPEFVDDELAETEEGDWLGVHRLFDEWLPSPTLSL
ncbi:hypothetical protein B0A55_12996 [Friedmanniomyces simplex]|uniref:Protein kinase domain-containing protein n=1 Tax=Friedmanniomyces simplex TaxID=329884 RepID=A0A4U0WG50_9PEZI|nr:hypothetical protein B0A55_12996 [Friedmanniomyces simplex]